MRQRMIGNALMSAGLVVMTLGLMATGAKAAPQYQDKVTSVSGSRSYDQASNTTTFTFTMTLHDAETVSHVVVSSCASPPAHVSRAEGPSDQPELNNQDPTTGRTGAKFSNARTGTYTVVFDGNVPSAYFTVKNGDGYKDYYHGDGCTGTPVTSTSTTATTQAPAATTTTAPTTTTTASTTTTTTAPTSTTTASTTTTTTAPTSTTTAPTTTTTEATTTTSSSTTTTTEAPTTTSSSPLPVQILPTTSSTEAPPDSSPSSTTSSTQAGSSTSTTGSTAPSSSTTPTTAESASTTTTAPPQVLGEQLQNPSGTGTLAPSLEGTQELTNPPASIPRTGRNVGDYLLVAGVALLVGGLALRYGDGDRTATSGTAG